MEESTESHMETDVSSTTDDVPETQEVTGSDGNVEMIIVVEKMDEEPSADEETEKQPSPVYEYLNNLMTQEDKSPEIETLVPKSPAKSPVKSPAKPVIKLPVKSPISVKSPTPVKSPIPVQSPIKCLPKSPANSPIKSPTKSSNIEAKVPDAQSKPELEQNVVEVTIQQQNEVPPSVETQQIEAADSSMEPLPIQSEDKPTQIQKTPKKEGQKPVQKSPIKELQSLDSSLTKDSKQGLIDKILINGKVQCNDTNKIDDTNTKTVTTIIPIDITNETSNDSQIETLSDVSEKEPKSISRELKSLINSAKESKIISECTQLTSKTRKSRTALDNSSSSLNSSLVEPNKIHEARRNSDMSQKSNCSEKSDRVVLKRSMRSQNPEFVNKVKQFLNSVTGKGNKDSDDEEEEDTTELEPVTRPTPPKLKKTEPVVTEKSNKLRSDSYCWRCHWVVEQVTNEKLHPPMQCTVCPRSFHFKCLTGTERNKINLEKNWVCPECMVVLQAESSETRSQAMKKISLGMLCDLLKHALERMTDLNGVEPFMQPVDRAAFPDYDKYVVHPMDLSLMKENIGEGLYGSTEAFLADAQWILHNSIIFNTLQSKLTAGARALVRSCRAEMGEIEACPECYAAAHARRPTWFTDVCTTPHILFWAKLKGFPYWPAKGMSVNSAGLVDVRFFGAHDRAWVPAKDCFLYSEKDPNNFRTKRQDIIDSMQEAEQHIRNISRKYGRFVYPPFKTIFDPSKMYEQLKMMIPTFEGEVRSLVKEKASPATAKEKSRSNSKSSKGSFNDGLLLHSDSSDSDEEELQRLYALLEKTSDTSDNEDTNKIARKMADGAEIVQMEDDDSSPLDKEIETETLAAIKTKEDSQSSTSTSSSRKRRRSELEEAVITIIESSGSSCSSTSEKRRKLDDFTEDKKSDENEPSSSKADDKATTDKSKEETNEATQSKTNEATQPKANEATQSKTSETPGAKDTDPRISVEKETQRVTPIRIALVTKEIRKTRNSSSKDTTAKIITPSKDKEQEKTPQRRKSTREKADKTPSAKTEKVEKPMSKVAKTPSSKSEKVEKTPNSKSDKVEKTPSSKSDKAEKTPSDKSAKEDRPRYEKRSTSKSRRSTNNTSATISSDKTEKKSEKNAEGSSKEKRRGSSSSTKEKERDSEGDKSRMEKQMSPKSTPQSQSPKSVKDRLQFDDDTTLAVLARETSKSTVVSHNTGLPTISCVRSLSTTAQHTGLTITKTTTNANTIDITEEATSDSSIFTPTSSENVITMQDAVSKLQRLRNDVEPVVGRVGVRAFARMTSPERQNTNDEVQVEIKAEPIDLDDADRHMEKMNLMDAFRLRPVNPQNVPKPPTNLRDVRINKVVVTPLNARKAATATATVTKAPEVRPRAKKTFPQPKKPEEGRSDLNSKNSMVYIPIQPPMTQAPVRLPRPQNAAPLTVTSILRPPVSSAANNLVNTVTTPLMQPSSSPPSTSAAVTTSTSVASVPTVHTVPLMTSVNGQWMFSFQPVMSVGAIDSAVSPPMLNGVAERGGAAGPLATLTPAAPAPAPAPPITVLSRTPTENTLGEPPRLQQRPPQFLLNPLDASTPIGSMPAPSTAGPVTAKLNQNAVKMTDFFRTLLEDSLEKLDEPWSQLTTLRLQVEQDNWRHQQELKEVKHNHDLIIAEMRTSFDKEKIRAVSEARRTAQVELEAAVKLAKSKQWCANCKQEAQFYCCWNTSYCDLPCQRAHWSQHFSTCQQRSQNDSNGEPPSSPENRLQPQPDLPKNSSTPTLTVGGKVAPSRGFTQDPNSTQKTSIIVSMVEDTSGNQTMKCVGTYKPSTPNQIQPIIINKQLMNNEENANKKVVSSSGGYLIVGAPNNSSVVTPARRTHTIQYYT